jgi:hypothetical protein
VDLEKLIFIILAIGLSIFSMYAKSRKQKQTVSEKEESEPDFFYSEESSTPSHPDEVFDEFDVSKLLQNFNISPKKQKKKPKIQNLEKKETPQKNADIILQNNDIVNDADLLEGFEGTEIQKAFLYSEIFKNAQY